MRYKGHFILYLGGCPFLSVKNYDNLLWEVLKSTIKNADTEIAELENNKELIRVLWSGAEILRSIMDANEKKLTRQIC